MQAALHNITQYIVLRQVAHQNPFVQLVHLLAFVILGRAVIFSNAARSAKISDQKLRNLNENNNKSKFLPKSYNIPEF